MIDVEPLTDEEIERVQELNEKDPDELNDAEITSKIRLSLKRRYSRPEWVLLFEHTGPDGRRADCIAVNTFPSRNYKILGFEFKASRSDWLAEKNDGRKADHFVQICDEWYVVAGRTGIVDESELPEGWGLLELKPNSEQLWKLAESELTDHQAGEPGRRFWVDFLEKTVGDDSNFSTSDVREAKRRGYQSAKVEGTDALSEHEIRRLRKKAESWENLKETGFPLYRVDEDDIEALRAARSIQSAVLDDGWGSVEGEIDSLRSDVERHAEKMLDMLDGFDGAVDRIREAFEEVSDE